MTALNGWDAGKRLPVPGSLSGRRRQIYKWFTCDIIFFEPVRCLSPQGRGPGFCAGPTYLCPGPKLHLSRYLIDWGACPKNSPNSRRRTLPYALIIQRQHLPRAHGLSNFVIALYINFRAKISLKSHCRYRNSAKTLASTYLC